MHVGESNGHSRRRRRQLCARPGCGVAFAPNLYQKIPLCPFHRRLWDAERWREKKAQWRERIRREACAYLAATGTRRSR
jgi:hypothetical protein